MNEPLRKAYERYWIKRHPDYAHTEKLRAIWLKRSSDTWGEPGYMQPIVHFDWLAFKAGAAYGRRTAD